MASVCTGGNHPGEDCNHEEGKGKILPYNEATSLTQQSGVVFPRIQVCEREDHRAPYER